MSYTTLVLWILGIAYLITCCVLILLVLLQEGKSGGMAGMDSAAQSPEALQGAFGAGGAQRGLYNATRIGAAIFFVLALALTVVGNQRTNQGGSLDLPEAEKPAVTQPVDVSATPGADDATPAANPDAAPDAATEAAPAAPAEPVSEPAAPTPDPAK